MPKKPDIDESILQINPDELDEEWLNQPDLFFQYAKRKALADKELDEAKSELDVVEADLDKAIRGNPGKYGLEKITDKSIEKAIIRHLDYQNALVAVQDAKYKAAVLDAFCKALGDHRKKALENLVFLHGQNYFSEPKAKGEESREATREFQRRKVRKGIRPRDEDDDE